MSKLDANLDEGGTKELDLDGAAINLLADSAVTGDLAVSGDSAVTGDSTVTGDLTVTGAAIAALVVVADPGDGLTIAPPASGADFSCDITTAAAETRVLGTPTLLGQRAYVVFDTDVDDFLMSNASGWIDGADNTLTFDDVGDACSFEALGTGAVTDWRLVSKKGVALTTV